MLFSSPEYTEPDVVVIYGNEHEMSTSGKDVIHSEISYRNMTHSRDTVLVLMDATKDLVIQGIKAVKAVQSVDNLVKPQPNALYRPTSNCTEIDAGSQRFNENHILHALEESN